MSNSIDSKDLWIGMKEYYDMGLSMIWSRTEAEVVNGVDRLPKTPLGTWKTAQKIRFSLDALSKIMSNAKVDIAPTVVCGEISGNLEIIDVDEKHWPGIAVLYFTQVQTLFPALFDRLRIHRTPSGGYQIWYWCETPINIGNKKLAQQLNNTKAGLETRGEGGYALCPPGAGYTIHQDRPIPTITRAERDALITIATLFDEKIKIKEHKTVKEHDSVYDENPFNHYNSSSDAELILQSNGWKIDSETPQFTHYTRPDKPSGISASWIRDKRIYHIFTSSTSLEPETNYNPAALLNALRFNHDWKLTYKYLVDSGFGKVKRSYEKNKVKAYAQVKDKDLPANFSQEARGELEQQRTDRQLNYPFGTYWLYNEESDSYSVSLTEMMEVANAMGIARYNGNLVHIEDSYFTRILESRVQSMLAKYIKEKKEDYKKINDSLMAKWKQYSEFFSTREELHEIDKKDILRSTEFIYYKPFLNGVLEITKEKIELVENISKYGKLIDRDAVISFPWSEATEESYKECMYVRYLRLAISTDWKYVQKSIGYLVYNFKSRGKGYLIMLLEGMEKGKGGGSGKGMFFEMLGDAIPDIVAGQMKKWTTVLSISGGQIEKGEAEMMQMWNGEWIVHFSDTPKNVNLSKLKDGVTDGGPVKKLYKDIKRIGADEYPNIGLSSQWGINQEDDPGVMGRVRVLTFTNYFNRSWEVRDEFKGSFPNIWEVRDWIGYYNYIANGIRDYMISGKLELIEDGELLWQKKFDHSYGMGRGELRDWIHDQVMSKWGNVDHIRSSELQSAYEGFCNVNNIKREMSIPRLHDALTGWGDRYGYKYQHGVLKRVDGERVRVSIMKRKGEEIKESEGVVDPWNEEGGWNDEDPPF